MSTVSDYVLMRLKFTLLDKMAASRRSRSLPVNAVNCSIFIAQGLFIATSNVRDVLLIWHHRGMSRG
jgi:hypothetical protein